MPREVDRDKGEVYTDEAGVVPGQLEICGGVFFAIRRTTIHIGWVGGWESGG